MNKKGISLPVKILIGLILLLTFFAGADNISMGLTRTSLIGKIIPSLSVVFVAYVIVGLSVLITAAVLSFKIFKKK